MAEDESARAQTGAAQVVPLPADWPGHPLPLMPGDFSKYAPQGLGLGPPPIVRPWDDPFEFFSRPNYYGFDPPETDPVRAAPSQQAAGGVIYFGNSMKPELLRGVLDTMGVRLTRRDYAVFAVDAQDTLRERFLTQVRIIGKSALGQLFGAGEHAAGLTDQPLTIEQFVTAFLDEQRARWYDQLYGKLGGDGDWAKESLAFGFLVENGYWSVYRVWSRPWLATK